MQKKLPRFEQPKKQPLGEPNIDASGLIGASVKVGRSGSGTIVHVEGGMALILTCDHVLQAVGATTTIKLTSGKVYQAEMLCNDKTKTDLATYVVTLDRDVPVVPVADSAPTKETLLVGIGYSDGTPRPRTLTYDGGRGNGPNELGVSFLVDGGDSGGGVFADGKLVGVISKRRSERGPGPGLIIAQPACKRFVDACLPHLRKRLGRGEPDRKLDDLKKRLDDATKKLDEALDGKPPVVPPTTPPQSGKDADISVLQTFIAAEIAKIKVIPGPEGPAGKDGRDGKDGKDSSSADLTALHVEINALRLQLQTQGKVLADHQRAMESLQGAIRVTVQPK